MQIPILQELARLRLVHDSSKIKSSSFQPNDSAQRDLIIRNEALELIRTVLRKERSKFIFDEEQRDAEVKNRPLSPGDAGFAGESIRASRESVRGASRESIRSSGQSMRGQGVRERGTDGSPSMTKRVGTGSPSIKRGSSKLFNMDDFALTRTGRPSTTGTLGITTSIVRHAFDSVLKTVTANDDFCEELTAQVGHQSNDSRRIFESLLTHFKGGLGALFSPKRPFEVVDVGALVAASQPVRTGAIKLEDIQTLKKKDGIALFLDPATSTDGEPITMRVYYQRAVDLVSEESCTRDYVFQSNGNYYGLHLIEEGANRDSRRPSELPSPTNRLGSPSNSTRRSDSPANSTRRPGPSPPLAPLGGPGSPLGRPGSYAEARDRDPARRSLPGWGARPPIFIPSTRCSIELLRSPKTAHNATVAFNLSRLRIFAVPGATARAAVKKLHEFCDIFFVKHTSNLLVAGGISALNLAALHGNLQAVVQLVQSGAAINARQNAKNHTALHEATIGGHKEVATYLLSMGANQLLRDDQGYTPLHHACRLEIISLARVLIQDASGKRALLTSDNNDQKPIELCSSPFMRQRVEAAMRKLKIFVKPRVSILDR